MFLHLVIILAIYTLIFFFFFKKSTRENPNYYSNKNPPGPKGLPIIGNLHQFNKESSHTYLYNLYEKFGPIVYLKHGSTPVIVINTRKEAKQILKLNDLSFCSRPRNLGQQKLSYGGKDMAFSPYDDHWKQIRKICVSHLLSPKRVHSFRGAREDEVSHTIEKISSLCDSSKAANLSDLAMSLASNLICRVAFGRRYDDGEYEKIRFDKMIMEAQSLMTSFYFSDHFPFFGWILDKASGLSTRVANNCKDLDEFYQQIIDEHLDPFRAKPEREDIVDLMLQFMLHEQDEEGSLGFELTMDHIKALLMNLFVAATDTVAAAIVWSMTALMLHPKIMSKAQKQIRRAFGDGKKRTTINEEEIHKIPYLKAMVLESLRLYPPAPLLYRTLIKNHDDPCSLNGYNIRPGTSIFINAWAMARDSNTWENPNEFMPERFLKDDGTVLLHDFGNIIAEFEMIPFGGGRRGCPGMNMGLTSVELSLANLLYAFDWALPSTEGGEEEEEEEAIIDTEALPGLTMHKKKPLILVPINKAFIH